MTDTRYPTGDPLWYDLQAAAIPANGYSWLALLDTYVPDLTTDTFVADVVAFELTNGSYGRIAAAGAVVAIDLATAITTMKTDDPDFGSPVGGEDVGSVVLFADTGADATSTLMGAFGVTWTTDGTPFVPTVNPLGLARFKNP